MSENNLHILSVNHLQKIYTIDKILVHALRGVTLSIDKGEFVAIMGASGSGKSTFMNIIGCLDKPTKGDYIFEGINVSKLKNEQLAKIRNKKIGFVFQGFNLLQRTSALENVELPLFYSHENIKSKKEMAMDALKLVGLEDRFKHFPNQLSGGQQQRVAIARALVNNPSIILADEPTGNLDSRTSVEIMEIFQQLNEKGITIILVTHEHDISEFTKRNIIFKDGKVISDFTFESWKIAKEKIKEMPQLKDEE